MLISDSSSGAKALMAVVVQEALMALAALVALLALVRICSYSFNVHVHHC